MPRFLFIFHRYAFPSVAGLYDIAEDDPRYSTLMTLPSDVDYFIDSATINDLSIEQSKPFLDLLLDLQHGILENHWADVPSLVSSSYGAVLNYAQNVRKRHQLAHVVIVREIPRSPK